MLLAILILSLFNRNRLKNENYAFLQHIMPLVAFRIGFRVGGIGLTMERRLSQRFFPFPLTGSLPTPDPTPTYNVHGLIFATARWGKSSSRVAYGDHYPAPGLSTPPPFHPRISPHFSNGWADTRSIVILHSTLPTSPLCACKGHKALKCSAM